MAKRNRNKLLGDNKPLDIEPPAYEPDADPVGDPGPFDAPAEQAGDMTAFSAEDAAEAMNAISEAEEAKSEAEANLVLAEERIEELKAQIKKLEEARSVDIVPSMLQLEAEGFSEEEAAKLIAIVEAAKVRAAAPLKKVKIASVPGLKISSRMPRSYWCAGHCLSPGREWTPALDSLNEGQLVEIEHKKTGPKATIIVEEVMVDVEVEIDDAE